jgi:hypothetical protein
MSSVAGNAYGLNTKIVDLVMKGGSSEHSPAICKKLHEVLRRATGGLGTGLAAGLLVKLQGRFRTIRSGAA